MKKLQAFTVTELVVAMALATIVVSLAFSAFRYIQAQTLTYQKNSEQNLSYLQWHTTLHQDFEQAEEIYLQDNTLRLISPQQVLLYTFEDSLTLRAVVAPIPFVDTIEVAVSRLEGFYEELPVVEGLVDRVLVGGELLISY